MERKKPDCPRRLQAPQVLSFPFLPRVRGIANTGTADAEALSAQIRDQRFAFRKISRLCWVMRAYPRPCITCILAVIRIKSDFLFVNRKNGRIHPRVYPRPYRPLTIVTALSLYKRRYCRHILQCGTKRETNRRCKSEHVQTS